MYDVNLSFIGYCFLALTEYGAFFFKKKFRLVLGVGFVAYVPADA